MAALFQRLQRMLGLGPARWPDGEPLISSTGERWGTRTPDGVTVLASGVTFRPLLCSRCQQPVEPVADQGETTSRSA